MDIYYLEERERERQEESRERRRKEKGEREREERKRERQTERRVPARQEGTAREIQDLCNFFLNLYIE